MKVDVIRPRVGTAGWSIPKAVTASFPGDGQHLDRYARVFGCAEINTSFYRSHRPEIYARWAAQTPAHFRFAVKLPRAITHEGALRRAREPLARFMAEVSGLGDRLGVLLVQLPPSLEFDARRARSFFGHVRAVFGGAIVCEPRHATWFTPQADRLLIAASVGRVAADPARVPEAAVPGGWLGSGDEPAVAYHRWHGSPKVYWSSYSDEWLMSKVAAAHGGAANLAHWFIFDNTASGAAAANALEFQRLSGSRPPGAGLTRR